jgi:hypothetical protein
VDELQDILKTARNHAARGDFSSARRVMNDALAARPDDAAVLGRQARAIEVLEGVDVVRRLLRDGQVETASRAATTILEALERDEYAGLGVSSAALALLLRANEVAQESLAGATGTRAREAFVTHMETELEALCRESVERPLESSRLGELLARKPFRSGLHEFVPAEDAEQLQARPKSGPKPEQPRQAATPVFQGQDGSPVIGRILIEQERAAAQAATASGGGNQDVFEFAGKAAVDYWHAVLFLGLMFGAFGYLGIMATPDRFESKALLQRTQASTLRAPITGRPQHYVPALPQRTVLQLVRLPAFHTQVAERLAEEGWTDGTTDPRRYDLEAASVAAALTVQIEDTGSGTYMMEFRAVHEDPLVAQAIAGAASEEFRVYHTEHVTREAIANFDDYSRRQTRIAQQLGELRQRRLEEFAIEDVHVLGVTLSARIDRLIDEIRSSRLALDSARIDLRSASEERATQQSIADRLPRYVLPEADERVTRRRALLLQLEDEHRELSRNRDALQHRHPRVKRIAEIEEEMELLAAEIAELERTLTQDESERKLNPDRALAEDRVAKAQSRVTLAQERIDGLEARIPLLEAELRDLRRVYLDGEELRRTEADLLSQHERNEVVLEEISAVRDSADRELTLVSPAAPATMVEKNALVGIAMGVVLGLVIGLIMAVGLLRRRQRLKPAAA